jgi:hypothetical protein
MELRKFIKTTIREYLNEQETLKNVINGDNFKKWFRNSEMVKSDGTPMIFYHGTNKQFDKFDKSMINTSTDAGWLGYGFYFYTDINEARQYGKVRSFFLNIENPYYATDEDNERLAELNNVEASKEFTDNLISDGYDGVYYNGNLRGETVVFEPNQIWEIEINSLNENIININKMNAKEIIQQLDNIGIKVSKKENFYNGSNYGEKYSIIGSDDVDGKTPYMGIPTKVKSQGFITKKGVLQNYFYHTGNGFETTKDFNEFLRALGEK